VLAPEHPASLQPVKVEPEVRVAARVTEEYEVQFSVQSEPNSMPGEIASTAPSPPPDL
jgi:hypothetical protein